MKNLDRLVAECKADIESLGIELGNIISVTVNTRAKRRWGQCCGSPRGYRITISDRLLKDDVDDMATKNTIAHELLHTICGGNGHTGEWKKAAEKLNRAYGYNIKRCTSSEEKGVENVVSAVKRNGPKYIIRCENCGLEFKYYKKSKMITNFIDRPDYVRKYCRCSKCKSHNLVLEGWQILTTKPNYRYL